MTQMDKFKAMTVEEFSNFICENPENFIADILYKTARNIMEEINPCEVFDKQSTIKFLESEVEE